MEKEKLLHTLYFSPSTLYTSVNSLYSAVKQKGMKLKDVKEFIQKQESTQLFKRIHSYFPNVAKYKFKLLRIDIVDMSDISTANQNYRYLLTCIAVFSRLSFVVPMKNKECKTVQLKKSLT